MAKTTALTLPGVLLFAFAIFGSTRAAPEDVAVSFVGRPVCTSCHADEAASWEGSDHALAMQEATESTVLGNFDDASVDHFGITSTFYREDEKFFVRTDGPDGTLQEYQIAYTFGVFPLQQYLIAFPGGRLQALGIAWDSRPAAEGGERWFHLYPDQAVPFGDRLHWTKRDQTWNFMCADCHSTNLRKNYDLATDGYATTWSEINVSCEACHGPGSAHVGWAQSQNPDSGDPRKGFAVRLSAEIRGHWELDPNVGTATRTEPRQSVAEIDTCARCHARRREIASQYEYGRTFLDTHAPTLLDAGMYHADGQILEEVYEYGSFRQSLMFQKGVTCSNCHDPHGLELRAPGNAVCAQCHLPEKFDNAGHHHHEASSTGALCANCHMPSKTYMVIDVRRDHAIRIPRPDLTIVTGAPNACTQCHTERSPEWAAAAIDSWVGADWRNDAHYGLVINAARKGLPNAGDALAELVTNAANPDMVRATALSLLPQFTADASTAMLQAYVAGLDDNEPLVRAAAVGALGAFAPESRLQAAGPRLADPVRAVRIEAARMLAGVPPELMSPEQRVAFERASVELIDAQMASAERPEAHLTLGAFYAEQRRAADAEAAYRTALRLDPEFVPAMVNLADLYRALQRDDDGELLLRRALTTEPDNADAHHALGLLLVRRDRLADAIQSFARAAELAPDNGRYAYVYGIALNSNGRSREALDVLRHAWERQPADADILTALASISRDIGDVAAAVTYAEALVRLLPNDAQSRALLESLTRQ